MLVLVSALDKLTDHLDQFNQILAKNDVIKKVRERIQKTMWYLANVK